MSHLRIKSAIDWWISILFWSVVLLLLFSFYYIPEDEQVIGYITVIPMLIFLLWIYFGTYYEFREEYLFCKSGPFFENIKYDNIKSIKLTQNLFSSMALSSKRIEIRQHGKGYILGTTFISPMNRQEFINELIKRCKNLEKL